jgi:hypothetical protein
LSTTKYGPYEHRRRSTGENATHEDDHRGPDREDQRQYSSFGRVPDTEDNSDPSLDTGNGTRSSAMTGWRDRE